MDQKSERDETRWETLTAEVDAAEGVADAIIRLVLELRLEQDGRTPQLERVIAF